MRLREEGASAARRAAAFGRWWLGAGGCAGAHPWWRCVLVRASRSLGTARDMGGEWDLGGSSAEGSGCDWGNRASGSCDGRDCEDSRGCDGRGCEGMQAPRMLAPLLPLPHAPNRGPVSARVSPLRPGGPQALAPAATAGDTPPADPGPIPTVGPMAAAASLRLLACGHHALPPAATAAGRPPAGEGPIPRLAVGPTAAPTVAPGPRGPAGHRGRSNAAASRPASSIVRAKGGEMRLAPAGSSGAERNGGSSDGERK